MKSQVFLILLLIFASFGVRAEEAWKRLSIRSSEDLQVDSQIDIKFDPKKIPDLKTISIDEINLNLERIGKDIQIRDLQMKQGGSDSGGGQGVFDRKTGRLHFIDIYYPEELRQMDLSDAPVQDVLSKFPSCAKFSSAHENEEMVNAMNEAAWFANGLEGLLPGLLRSPRSLQVSLSKRFTYLKLRQLQDATNFPRGKQVQLAIYNDGIAFFQAQAVALMAPGELKWLMVKEFLRYLAKANRTKVENPDVENAVRLLFHDETAAFLDSSYVRKLMRPHFGFDIVDINLGLKRKYIADLLERKALTASERAIFIQDLSDIDLFSELETRRAAGAFAIEQYPPEFLYRDDEWTRDEMQKGQQIESAARKGFIPEWAVQAGVNEKQYKSLTIHRAGRKGCGGIISERRAPIAQGFDVEAGRLVWDLRDKCAPDIEKH